MILVPITIWRWDRMYLEKARKAGVEIEMYQRYVDDSNQIDIVPPKGAKYDIKEKKVQIDHNLIELEEEDDKRIARILTEIANDVMPCIKMEADWPTKNEKKKLPILDMEVWMQNGWILYSHYEKPMSCRSILNSKSAHPTNCKKGVHTQEILRRIINCSQKLDWNKETVPFLNDYMMRMKEAGYTEGYRKAIMTNALRIHEKKLKDEEEGKRPIFRPKTGRKRRGEQTR